MSLLRGAWVLLWAETAAGASYDRNFRQVLQECPELRGSDYSDKQSLEEDKMLQLGYQPKIKEDKIIKEIAKPYKDHE